MTMEEQIAQAVLCRVEPHFERLMTEIEILRRRIAEMQDRSLSMSEVCEILGKSSKTVVKLFREGSILGRQINGVYYFRKADVDDFMRSPRDARRKAV